MEEDLTDKVETYGPNFKEGDILVAQSAEEIALKLPSKYKGLIPFLESIKPVAVVKSCVFSETASDENYPQYNLGVYTQGIENFKEWITGEEDALYEGTEEELEVRIPQNEIWDFFIKSTAKTIDEAIKLYDGRTPSSADMKEAYHQSEEIQDLVKGHLEFLKLCSNLSLS